MRSFLRLISGYTDAAERRYWREKGEREARHKYDEARKAIIALADEFRGIEDTIEDGIASMDDAGYVMNYLTERSKKLSDLFTEVHRWKTILKAEYGVDP